jgi:hypothetical protein
MSVLHRKRRPNMGRLRRSFTVAFAASTLLAAPSLVAADATDARATPDASYASASSPETRLNPESYDAGVVKPASVISAQTLSIGSNVMLPTMPRSVDDTTALALTEPAASNAGGTTTIAAPESTPTPTPAPGPTPVPKRTFVEVHEIRPMGSDPKGCALYNEVTTACSSVCGNNKLCIKYRWDGRCVNDNYSTCVRPEGGLCAYKCFDDTSGDSNQWFVNLYGVPTWDISFRSNRVVEAMRPLDVPHNTTQLYVANRWRAPSCVSFSPSGVFIC